MMSHKCTLKMPLSTPALKTFNLQIDPIDVAVGVGSTTMLESGTPSPSRSEWTASVGTVQLDLQQAKCIKSGSVSVSAAVGSNTGGESTSILTPVSSIFKKQKEDPPTAPSVLRTDRNVLESRVLTCCDQTTLVNLCSAPLYHPVN